MRLFVFLLFFSFICQAQIVDRFTRFESGAAALYNVSNAASPTDEANTTTAFVDRGLPNASMSISSVSTITGASDTSPQDGSYSILIEQTGLDNNDGEVYVTVTGLEDGAEYQVDVYVQDVVGTTWVIKLRTGFGWVNGQSTNTDTPAGWVQYSLTDTTNSTSASITFGCTTSGDNGDRFAIDNIVITKQ